MIYKLIYLKKIKTFAQRQQNKTIKKQKTHH